ncbi:hypothetical protein SteCoe_36097 [Stentor coeruleus]|uniref:RING-type domain-containing protein n=1 Tax=Stentor coeruleus TaxID=5963 RepID=A0A1R2AQV4_9CILI|nr:hypothetical protein SteCoe_36097 [Stentor coeruleus]
MERPPDSIEKISEFFKNEVCYICTSCKPKKNQNEILCEIQCENHYMCIKCRKKWYRVRSTLSCKCERNYNIDEIAMIEKALVESCAICYEKCETSEIKCSSCMMKICDKCKMIRSVCCVCADYACPLCKNPIRLNYVIDQNQKVPYIAHPKCSQKRHPDSHYMV